MAAILITQIPNLDTVVIRQKGVRLFVAAPDSIVISKESYLSLLTKLLEMEFIKPVDIAEVLNRVIGTGEEDYENETHGSYTDFRESTSR